MTLSPARLPDALDPERMWALLALQPNMGQERRQQLANYLADQAASLYTPFEKVLVMRGRGSRRHREILDRPLLGSYGLAQLPRVDPPFGRLLSAQAKMFGIIDVVRGYGGFPAPVPNRVVAHLVDRDSSGEFNRFEYSGKQIVRSLPVWLFVGAWVVVRETHNWLGGMQFQVRDIDRRRNNRVTLTSNTMHIPLYVQPDDLRCP